MNKNFVFSVMMVMALVFGLTVIGCDNDTTSKDTWSELTDFNQLNGTWKANYSQKNRPIKDVLEEYGMEWNSSMQLALGDMKVTIKADVTLTINTDDMTREAFIKSTATFSGGNIKVMWPFLKQGLESSDEEEGVKITTIDKTHSVITEYSYPAGELTEEDIDEMLNSGLQINQSGTKIKIPADTFVPGMPELIFYKQ
jgi:hypothetical protein